MAKRLRIDVALDESAAQLEPLEVEIPRLGVFQFPAMLNAAAHLRVARWKSQGKMDALTDTDCYVLLSDVVPLEIVSEWSRAGFNVRDEKNAPAIEKILMTLLTEYAHREVEGETSGKPEAPPATTAGPSSSGSDGISWSPTSPESMASTSPPIYEH